MALTIGKKIAELRRESNKTQEQLATYVGVSTAAVSKWETGQAYPDITLLTSIADFFEVSVDGLLSHQITNHEQALKQIHQTIADGVQSGNYDKALPIITDALKKYPNDFTLLNSAANLTASKAWFSQTKTEGFTQAIAYAERAIQCAPDKRQPICLKQSISFNYDAMGETDKAIAVLKEIGENGRYDADIARLMRKKGETSEAKQLLQRYLWNMAFEFWGVAGALAGCYQDAGDMDMACEAQKLHATFLSALTGDTPSYTDWISALSYGAVAEYCKKLGRTADMWANLERAAYHAIRFDQDPSFKMNASKFMDGLPDSDSVANNSRYLVCHGLLKELREKYADFAQDERYTDLYRRVDEAKRSKAEAGIW